ncbi:MFS transporter [Rhodospirillaceae bacterium]|nr:MFS transporter [Rhodospirillaceae bacterium]MDC0999061.1 MFS transporter [Alphaproteobacteria bacterium]MDC1441223.1 MFS transporter [Rhodospirillaceae bacterium]
MVYDQQKDFKNYVLVASLLFMIIGTGSVYFLVVALKLISTEFNWPRAVPSFAYALQYFGAGFGGIVMGYILDKVGMGIPALIGATMIGLGAIMTSYVSSPWHLYVIYGVLMGFLGRSALFSPLTANITRWFETNKGKAVGIVGSGQAISGAIWPPIFQYSFEIIGWRETAFWYGVFVLISMLPLVLILRKSPNKKQDSVVDKPVIQTIKQNGAIPSIGLTPLKMQIILSIASIGCCVAMSLPLAHLVAHMSDIGFGSGHGARLISLMLMAAGFSSFFGVGFLGDKFGGLQALFIFSIIQALFLGLLSVVDSLFAIYASAILFGIGYGGILPCYPLIVREYLPAEQAGRRTAVVVFCGGAGMALGGWMGGVIFDATGSYAMAFWIGVGFNLFNLIIVGNLISRNKNQILAEA